MWYNGPNPMLKYSVLLEHCTEHRMQHEVFGTLRGDYRVEQNGQRDKSCNVLFPVSQRMQTYTDLPHGDTVRFITLLIS